MNDPAGDAATGTNAGLLPTAIAYGYSGSADSVARPYCSRTLLSIMLKLSLLPLLLPVLLLILLLLLGILLYSLSFPYYSFYSFLLHRRVCYLTLRPYRLILVGE